MPDGTTTIVVGIDGSSADEFTLRWALAEAASSNRTVRLVTVYDWPVGYGTGPQPGHESGYQPADDVHPRRVAEETIGAALAKTRDIDAAVTVTAVARQGRPVLVLLEESVGSAMVVLGARKHGALGSVLGSVSSAVAARASCPAVVVRASSATVSASAAVVVGLDRHQGESADILLGFGFDYAARHRAPLRAVACWHRDVAGTVDWRTDPPPPADSEAWLAETLTGWRAKYPDVVVETAVVEAHPTTGLVAESLGQRLLVVGTRGRNALAGTLLGSVSQGALHHAHCPVAVVATHAV